ncbi:hypothetical protein [Nonomuraea longicatena]|uniref:Uncharacterized protein n=1 Tax=Nonomuraea longicatena TaxID=83682 RepID=A0ABP4BER0_9ACTN
MYSDRRPLRRFLVGVAVVILVIFIVRAPEKAATVATAIITGLVSLIDTLAANVG